MLRLLILLATLLVAAMAHAGTGTNDSIDSFSNCAATPETAAAVSGTTALRISSVGDTLCYDYDDTGTADGAVTAAFRVKWERATVCLNADRNASAAGATVVDIQVCISPNDTAGDNTCEDTGLRLTSSNNCETIARGLYRYQIVTDPASAEDAQLVLRGY